MKIALIQTNPVIGDFVANAANMLCWLQRAKEAGCDLAVFPELAVSGYPPQDLLERPSFALDHAAALRHFAGNCLDLDVICGIIEPHTGPSGLPLHNSAALISNGAVVFTAQKRLLPTYDVFDERRYFEPGRKSRLCRIGGLTVALTVCEDIWNDDEGVARRLYEEDPVCELVQGGERPELLINIAASPYHLGKRKIRESIFSKLCRKHRLPLLYANQVGGQDALLFDGNSLAIDRDGKVLGHGALFREDMMVVEYSAAGLKVLTDRYAEQPDPVDAAAELFAALTMGTRDYVGKCGFSKVVIGLSGGIDSALTAAIAAAALGPENVLGVAMPSPYSSADSLEDAEALAKALGIEYAVLPVTDIFTAFKDTLLPLFKDFQTGVAEQNIQARIRGTLLMGLANKLNRLLLSTGNKSELAVGYCTLYGDMNGGLAVISDVPKQMVYRIAAHINREREIIPRRTIEKAPSAELAPNQKDQDDLPPYDQLDAILTAYLENNESQAQICARGFDEKTVADVVRRIRRNEYKRKQAPPGLRVTSKAFGYGRRYPIAENYQEGKEPHGTASAEPVRQGGSSASPQTENGTRIQ